MPASAVRWDIGPEEAAPSPTEPHPQPRQGWRSVALLAAAALIFLGGLALKTTGDARREREQLTATLVGVMQAEARAQAGQDKAAAEQLLDPEAPRDWAQRYRRLFGPSPVNPYNELCGVYGPEWHPADSQPVVTIEGERARGGSQRVLLTVAWLGGSAPSERRAYRQVDGAWRRSPLTESERTRGARQSRQVGEVLIEGPAGDVAALASDPALAVDFAALDRRVRSDLAVTPPFTSRPVPVTRVVVRPTELESAVIEVGIAPERLVVVNSPALALVNPDGPLSAAGLYRLALVQAVLSARYSQFGVSELPFGPYWALSDAERKEIRNHLRRALDGAWRSQLSREPGAAEVYQMRHRAYDEWQRRCISDALLVQQLLETGRVDTIAELVRRFSFAEGADGSQVLLDLSGQPDRAAYDDWARAWATTPEP